MNVATGAVIGDLHRRYGSSEFLQCLRTITINANELQMVHPPRHSPLDSPTRAGHPALHPDQQR